MHSKSIKSVGYPQFGESDNRELHTTDVLSMRKSYFYLNETCSSNLPGLFHPRNLVPESSELERTILAREGSPKSRLS